METTRTRDLRLLPKAHLHIHLEGAMRSSTLTELCRRYGIEQPTDTRFKRFDNFGGFLTMYWAACNVVRSRDDLARLIQEVAEDAAAEGVWWIEPAFDADRYSTIRNGRPDQLFDSQEEGWHFALQAAAKASQATGVGIGFISAIDRIRPVDEAMERATITRKIVQAGDHLIQNKIRDFEGLHRGLVGFGLHGNEAGHPPGPFAEAFRLALDDTGLISAPHAGEITPTSLPGSGAASVRAALEDLEADRIAHGVLATDDEELVARLAEENICLDICPTSNFLLKVVPSLENHPLKRLMAAGVPCTIGSDDPLLFGPDLVDEFGVCRHLMGLSDHQLAMLAQNSFQYSGAPEPVKKAGFVAINDWLSTAD